MTLKIKDPGSALTHFIAMILALCAASPLIIKAAAEPDKSHVLALSIFIVSMILLYAASTIYHTLDISPKINRMLRKVDHMMIFILIAGTYTPVCMLVLGDRTGWIMLALVWGIAAAGILINALWSPAPNGFPPWSTLPWAGSAYLPLERSSRHFRGRPLAGFWPAVSFIPQAA